MFNNHPEYYWRQEDDKIKIAEFYIYNNRHKVEFYKSQHWHTTEDACTPDENSSYWEITYGPATLDGKIHYINKDITDSTKVFGALFYIVYEFTKRNPNIQRLRYRIPHTKQSGIVNRYLKRKMSSYFPDYDFFINDNGIVSLTRKIVSN